MQLERNFAETDGLVDTLVMENLGYFQFKVSSPGVWHLSVAEGKSADVFELDKMVDTHGEVDLRGKRELPIVVDSLEGVTIRALKLLRREGMEDETLLEKDSTEAGSTAKRTSEETLAAAEESDDVIHVFSVASGHLYERFLKIMILSATKHASAPIKFWLLKNHLSAPFKAMLPIFAREYGKFSGHYSRRRRKATKTNGTAPLHSVFLLHYRCKRCRSRAGRDALMSALCGFFFFSTPAFSFRRTQGFDYELVTYKWPYWLREQTEKQRTIWGYKILFLDVLFPLSLRRVIFVDSDQIVRGDLKELYDTDLKGAVYGFTPFCDSRKEVEGYRFWKQGFWSTHLRSRKYHISALYVVDLVRMREGAAGDTLRIAYQQLSADPNSLSNLDQDLPNYVSVPTGSYYVRMFSLPEVSRRPHTIVLSIHFLTNRRRSAGCKGNQDKIMGKRTFR